jgi:hypothetical protein
LCAIFAPTAIYGGHVRKIGSSRKRLIAAVGSSRKRLIAIAAGSVALVTMGFVGAGQANSDDGVLDVSGQSYAQAVKTLRSMGYRTSFGGSVGSDVPQARCIVSSQKVLARYRVSLMLDCTAAAQPDPGENQVPGAPGPPRVGDNGVTTVTPTPVGPQPGMAVPGM